MAKVVASLPILAKEGSLVLQNQMNEIETKLQVLYGQKNKLI